MPLKTMVKASVHVQFVWRLASVLFVIAVIGKTSAEPKALTGRRAVSSKSPLVGLISNRSTITSSEPLFTYHGFPVAVQVFSGPTSRSVPCSIKGMTVIYKGSMLTLGQSSPSLSVAKLWGVTDDPITQLAYQSAEKGCIDYLELRTKAGRVLRAGSHNSSMPLQSLSGGPAESSLAGLIGFSKPTADVVAAQGQLTGAPAKNVAPGYQVYMLHAQPSSALADGFPFAGQAGIFFVHGNQEVAVLLDKDGISCEFLASSYCCPTRTSVLHVPIGEIICARYLPIRRFCMNLPLQMRKQHFLELQVLDRHPRRPWQWSVKRLELSTEHQETAKRWVELIRQRLQDLSQRPRRLLVFVNPFGGKRRARQTWQKIAAPVLAAAGVRCQVVETRHQGHAESVLRGLSLEQLQLLDGVVAVGGDGMFSELLTGVLQHQHLAAALQLRLAHIPAGSTDAVACTLHGTRDALTATLHIALGDCTPLDVARLVTLPALQPLHCHPLAAAGRELPAALGGSISVSTDSKAALVGQDQQEGQQDSTLLLNQRTPLCKRERWRLCRHNTKQQQQQQQRLGFQPTLRHFVCVASHGFLGDVMECSERLRWLGPARYDVAGLLKFLLLRGYQATGPRPALSAPTTPSALSAVMERPAAGLGGPDCAVTADVEGRRGTTEAGQAAVAVYASAGSATSLGSTAASLLAGAARGANSSSSRSGSQHQRCYTNCEVCGAAAMKRSSSRQLFMSESRLDLAASGPPGHQEEASSTTAPQPTDDKSRAGLMPGAHLADGRLVLVAVRKASRLSFLRFLVLLASRGVLPGMMEQWVHVEYVTGVQVVMGEGRQSSWNVDGELLKHGAVSVDVHAGLVDVFARGIEAM
eukprot:gene13622-13748_t